jgi:hypothetical protein
MPDDPVPAPAWAVAVLGYVADRTRVTLREILVHQFGWTQPQQWTMARYKRVAACLHQHGWQRTQLRVGGRHVKGFRRIPTRPAPPPLSFAPLRRLPRLPCAVCGGVAWAPKPEGLRCLSCRNRLALFACLGCHGVDAWEDAQGMTRCVRCTPPPRP